MKLFSNDLGVDLGTSNVLIYAAGQGIIGFLTVPQVRTDAFEKKPVRIKFFVYYILFY